jgi:ABC-type nitrate/sulfonate/bicarbonate transport system substrate-binding protein
MARLRSAALPLACLVAVALAAAGCSRAGEDRPNASATLVLAARPSAVDAGIELAVVRDFDGAEGVSLRVRPPSSRGDGLRRLLDGRADFAVLDIHDLALARERGRDVVGVMAIVQRPLAAILAGPAVGRPRDLAGRRVGTDGSRRDAAIVAAVVGHDGGATSRVRTVRVRAPLPAVVAGRVAAATGSWNADGVALLGRRPAAHVFRADDYGAPAFPELVLCVTRATLQDRRSLVRATVAAIRRGYEEALNDPESAVGAVVDRSKGLDRATVQEGFDAVAPAFLEGVTRFGDLDLARLRAWARWEAAEGIVKRPPDVALAFAPAF